ncbi:hypothetical protein ACO1O0_006853 [Amphichorda felina]
MCLKLHIHQTDCNSQSIVHIYHPFEEPESCLHTADYEFPDCKLHGPCCTYETRSVCDRYVGCSWFSCLGGMQAHLVITKGGWVEAMRALNVETIAPLEGSPRMDPTDEVRAHRALREYLDEGARAWTMIKRLGLDKPGPLPRIRLFNEADEELLRQWEAAQDEWFLVSNKLYTGKDDIDLDPQICHHKSTTPVWFRLFKVPEPPESDHDLYGDFSPGDDDDTDSESPSSRRSDSNPSGGSSNRGNSSSPRPEASRVIQASTALQDRTTPQGSAMSPVARNSPTSTITQGPANNPAVTTKSPSGSPTRHPPNQPPGEGAPQNQPGPAPQQAAQQGPAASPPGRLWAAHVTPTWDNFNLQDPLNEQPRTLPLSPRGTEHRIEAALPSIQALMAAVEHEPLWNPRDMRLDLPRPFPDLSSTTTNAPAPPNVPRPVELLGTARAPPNPFYQNHVVPPAIAAVPQLPVAGPMTRLDFDWMLSRPGEEGHRHPRDHAYRQNADNIRRHVVHVQRHRFRGPAVEMPSAAEPPDTPPFPETHSPSPMTTPASPPYIEGLFETLSFRGSPAPEVSEALGLAPGLDDQGTRGDNVAGPGQSPSGARRQSRESDSPEDYRRSGNNIMEPVDSQENAYRLSQKSGSPPSPENPPPSAPGDTVMQFVESSSVAGDRPNQDSGSPPQSEQPLPTEDDGAPGDTIIESVESPSDGSGPGQQSGPPPNPRQPAAQEASGVSTGSKRRRSSTCSLSPVPREWKLRRLSTELWKMGSNVVRPKRR